MIEPREFITRIRDIFPDGYAEMSFGCVKFAALLKRLYPTARCYTSIDHVITEIDGQFYDITGPIALTDEYAPIAEHPSIKKQPRGKELT